MARIRTIKPDFWQHPRVTKVSRDARLCFLGLLNEADDEGKLRLSPKRLAGVIFPDDDDVDAHQMTLWVGQLRRAGLVRQYEVDGASFLLIVGFTEHQRINRPSPSTLPDPLTEDSVSPPGDFTEGSLGERKGKEEEGKGTVAPAARAREGSVKQPRPKDPIFEAVCEACGIDWHELTRTGRGTVNTAVGEIRATGCTPRDISQRSRQFKLKYPGAALTPMALAKHWAGLGNGVANKQQERSFEESQAEFARLMEQP